MRDSIKTKFRKDAERLRGAYVTKSLPTPQIDSASDVRQVHMYERVFIFLPLSVVLVYALQGLGIIETSISVWSVILLLFALFIIRITLPIKYPTPRILSVIVVILFFGSWYLSSFYYIDAKNGCYIHLKTGLMSLTEVNHGNIKQAILALKRGFPEQYSFVCSEVEAIKPTIGCGGWQGGCYYSGDGSTITVATTNSNFLGGSAAVIVHEACHAWQSRTSLPMSESQCYAKNSETLQALVVVE